jgi:hypothetical protein
MNELNRTIIVLVAAAWIIVGAVVIFLTWAAPQESIDALFDVVEFLDDNQTTAGQLIFTLGALAVITLALLVIVIELGPEEQVSELKVEQAGATTIIPAEALRLRLREALVAIPEITDADVRVKSAGKGVAATLDLTVNPTANIAYVTQEAARVVVDTVQTDLGLPVSGVPTVRIAFASAEEMAASSVSQPPSPEPAPQEPPPEPAPTESPPESPSASSPGSLTYGQEETPAPPAPETPEEERREEQQP